MTAPRSLPMLLALALLPSCSDEAAMDELSDSTGGDSSSTTGANSTLDDPSDTGDPQTSSEEATSLSSSGGDTSSSDSTDATGQVLDPLRFDLVVQRDISGDLQLFTYRVVDGLADPLVRLHEQDAGRDWTSPQFLSDGRVLVERESAGGNELRIANLDDPSHTVRLDGATEPPGLEASPVVLPDESVLYPVDGFAYRVQLEGMQPIDNVALVPYGGFFTTAVDPQARYVVVRAAGNANALKVTLDDANATLLAGSIPHLSLDGSAGFQGRDAEDGTRHLQYLPLGDSVGTPVDLLPDLQPGQIADYLPSFDGVRPHPTQHGVAVTVTVSEGDTTLHYIGIKDGVALAPVLLDGPEVSGELHGPFAGPGWSPDGRWLGFEVYTEAGYEVWLADFGDGQEPELTLVAPTGPQWWPSFFWAPDSSSLYIGYPWADSKTPPRTERVVLTGDDPVVQAIGESRTHPLALSPDGTNLIYMQWEGDDPSNNRSLQLVDVSGSEPGEPSLLAESPAGGIVDDPSFSPDGRVVAYGREDGVRHLMLASLDDPALPHIEVTDATQWWFAP